MAEPLISRRRRNQLIRQLVPNAYAAFVSAVDSVSDSVRTAAINRAIVAGDIEAVLSLLRIEGSTFAALDQALLGSYAAGGTAAMQGLPKRAMQGDSIASLNFNLRSERALEWSRDHAGALVTGLSQDMHQTVRTIISNGISQDLTPIDIGRRLRGSIGLTERQAAWVANLGQELNDPTSMSNYFTRELRDRRFDSLVRKSLDSGEGHSAEVERITAAYERELLNMR